MIPASGEIELGACRRPRPSSMLMASGTSGAATRPCATRAATSRPASGAQRAQRRGGGERDTLARYTGSVPNRRARYAVAASPAPRASR